MTPSEAAHKFFKTGMTVGFSGFTPAGYPKVVPIALADMVEKEGAKLQFELFAGASVGAETEDRWAKLGMESRYSFPPLLTRLVAGLTSRARTLRRESTRARSRSAIFT